MSSGYGQIRHLYDRPVHLLLGLGHQRTDVECNRIRQLFRPKSVGHSWWVRLPTEQPISNVLLLTTDGKIRYLNTYFYLKNHSVNNWRFCCSLRMWRRVQHIRPILVQSLTQVMVEEKIVVTSPNHNQFLIHAVLAWPWLVVPVVLLEARKQSTIVFMTVVFVFIPTLHPERSWLLLNSHRKRRYYTGSATTTSGRRRIEIRLLANTGNWIHPNPICCTRVNHFSWNRSRPPSSTSPISSRRSRKQVPTYGTSRSESLERAGTSIGPLSQTEDDLARNRPPTKPK